MPNIQYFLESAFCLVCLYGLYWFLLRKETFFQWNRSYLLLAPVLAFLIPAICVPVEEKVEELPVMPVSENLDPNFPMLIKQIQTGPKALEYTLNQPLWSITLGEILWWLYVSVAGVFILRLLVQLTRLLVFLYRLRRHRKGNTVFASGSADMPLASFFGFVLWNPGTDRKEEQQLLLEHELVHVRQWHSLDVLFLELLIALQWFNPLLYLYRRSLRVVHEYIADDYVVRRTRQRHAYAQLLLRRQTAGNGAQPGLVNTFHTDIKNRLIMLAKLPSNPVRRIRYLLSLPLFFALLLLFSFRLIERLPEAKPILQAVENLEDRAAQWSDVVVANQLRPNRQPATSSCIFYWGALQVRLDYDPFKGIYFGEIHTSTVELKKSINREPRLWNGKSLEQYLSFSLDNFTIASDYNNPVVYQRNLETLLKITDRYEQGDVIVLNQILLSEGQKGEILLFLDQDPVAETPKAAVAGMQSPSFSTWGARLFAQGEQRFLTVDQFWDIMATAPRIYYTDQPVLSDQFFGPPLHLEKTIEYTNPAEWNVAVFDEKNRIVLRPRAERADFLSFEQLCKRLQDLNVKPGMLIRLSACYHEETEQEMGQIDCPTLVQFRMVNDTDPRLFLDQEKAHDYRLEWGGINIPRVQVFAKSYVNATTGQRLFTDPGLTVSETGKTRDELLQAFNTTPRFYRDNIPLPEFSFVILYQEDTFWVHNGHVPASFLEKMKRKLKAGDKLAFGNIQAETGHARTIVTTSHGLKTTTDLLMKAQGVHLISGSISGHLARLLIKQENFALFQTALADVQETWFQEGDINLGNTIIGFEVRSDDPKPELRPTQPNKPKPIELSVQPNPAARETTLRFKLPEAGTGVLSITDATGVVHYSKAQAFRAGENSIPLPLELINAKGVLFVGLVMPYGNGATNVVVE